MVELRPFLRVTLSPNLKPALPWFECDFQVAVMPASGVVGFEDTAFHFALKAELGSAVILGCWTCAPVGLDPFQLLLQPSPCQKEKQTEPDDKQPSTLRECLPWSR